MNPTPANSLAAALGPSAVLSALCCLSLVAPASALVPVPIKDIGTQTDGGSIYLGAELAGYLYYGACKNEDFLGCELYRTPIGGSGAELVRDIDPGDGSSSPRNFLTVGTNVFFRANSNQLWITDGTEGGTHLVRGFSQLYAGDQGAERWVALGDQVVFKAESSSSTGRELWVSDGTTTTQFDLCPGSCDGNPLFLTAAGSRVFFRVNDGAEQELWKYEGGSVSQVGDINPSGSAFPGALAPLGTGVVFFAQDAAEFGLWHSDGTTNTKLAGSAQFLIGAEKTISAGGLVYFDGYDGNSLSGRELWVTNGTPSGTGLIADINPGVGNSDPQDFVAVGSSIYFTANDGTNGRELWLGTPGGAAPLELVPGPAGPSTLTYITDLNGSQAVFYANDGTGFGAELWISNGTPGGTVRLTDLDPGPDDAGIEHIIAAQGLAFFPSYAVGGTELWRSNGAPGGTALLTEMGTGNTSGGPTHIVTFAGLGYFCADDLIHGSELWRTDATTSGTIRLEDLGPGDGFGCERDSLFPHGGSLYFAGYDGTDFGLWKSNGAPGGAVLVKNFLAAPRQLTSHAGLLYFTADDGGGAGEELWRSDGTTGGTVLVLDVFPGGLPANITDLTSAGGALYFGGRHTTTGDFELWKSDGTAGGTAVLKDIYPGTPGSFPSNFGSVGGLVVFTASEPTNGEELWITDGTPGGTTLLKDLRPGSSSGANAIDGYFPLGGLLYFEATDGTNGYELWRTDGSSGNTTMVADIRPGSSSSAPRDFAVVGTNLLFSADDGTTGRELWRTDGTTTSLVADIHPSGSSDPVGFFATGIGNQAYFSADAGLGGYEELWITDGTPGGTVQVADLHPDGGSGPRSFAIAGASIVFTASVAASGTELWSFGSVDCGDAPDPGYPTLLLSGGACHRYDPAVSDVRLGALRDADPDGQPTAGADGDDLDGTDDDDGVTFSSDFSVGQSATFDVDAPLGGYLNVWIDWDADGDWDELEDRVVFNQQLSAGIHPFSIQVPSGASIGETYARFRVDSLGAPFTGGILFDGETEDYRIAVVEKLDFGDAPDPLTETPGAYPTLLANDGARHRVVTGIHLGATVDDDADGQPTTGADGDDADGSDDDDGVAFTSALLPGANATVEIIASVEGYLYGWIDFDQNGIWNDLEELVIDGESMAAGANPFVFAVPAGATLGGTHARFRFDTNGDADMPTGGVADGEVEDYQVLVGTPEAADLGILASAPSTAIPGAAVQLTVVASSSGPSAVSGAVVEDSFDADLEGCTWTCSGSAGGSCAASGAGDVAEAVDLPVGASVTFVIDCAIAAGATGMLDNQASITPPVGTVDPAAGNDSSASSTTLEPTGDLSILKTDGETAVVPPTQLIYTILVENAGPSDAVAAQVQDLFPLEVTNVAWTCAGMDGGSCASSGSGDIDELVDLPAGGAVTFTATVDTSGGAGETAVNTAIVAGAAGFSDPEPGNDSATDETEYVRDPIFADGFESGDTSGWSSTIGGLAPIILLAEGADAIQAEMQLAARAIERSGRQVTRLLSAHAVDGGDLFRIVIGYEDGSFRLRADLATSSNRWVSSESARLDHLPERLEILWQRPRAGGAADGRLVVASEDQLLALATAVDAVPAELGRIQIHGVRDRATVSASDHPGWQASGGEGLLRREED